MRVARLRMATSLCSEPTNLENWLNQGCEGMQHEARKTLSEAELIINRIRKGMNRSLKSLGFTHHFSYKHVIWEENLQISRVFHALWFTGLYSENEKNSLKLVASRLKTKCSKMNQED